MHCFLLYLLLQEMWKNKIVSRFPLSLFKADCGTYCTMSACARQKMLRLPSGGQGRSTRRGGSRNGPDQSKRATTTNFTHTLSTYERLRPLTPPSSASFSLVRLHVCTLFVFCKTHLPAELTPQVGEGHHKRAWWRCPRHCSGHSDDRVQPEPH